MGWNKDEFEAVLQEKSALIESQSAEIDHLRAALGRIQKYIAVGQIPHASIEVQNALASYMCEDGWVRQLPDGTVVKSDA